MATRKKIPLINETASLDVTGDITITGSGSATITFPSSTATLLSNLDINDTGIATDELWSSNKINAELNTKADTTALHSAVTVSDSSEIDFTLTGQDITASLKTGSIDVLKLDAGVQTSLGLADSSTQPGDNISLLTNDNGYITDYTVTNTDLVGLNISNLTNDSGYTTFTANQSLNTTSSPTFVDLTLSGNNLNSSGDLLINDINLTADGQNDIAFFGDGSQAQSGNFENRVKIFGGGGQTRDFQIYQEYGGYMNITSSFGSNRLRIHTIAGVDIEVPLNMSNDVDMNSNDITAIGTSYYGASNEASITYNSTTETIDFNI